MNLVNLSPKSDFFGSGLSIYTCCVERRLVKTMLQIAEIVMVTTILGLYLSLFFPSVRMKTHERDERRIKLKPCRSNLDDS